VVSTQERTKEQDTSARYKLTLSIIILQYYFNSTTVLPLPASIAKIATIVGDSF